MIFFYKLFYTRDKFPFFIVRIPHLKRNIPSTILYDSIFLKFLRIARFTLKLEYFLPRASKLCSPMLWANQSCVNKQILKGFQRYPDVLKNMAKIITNFFKNLKIITLQNNYGQIIIFCL